MKFHTNALAKLAANNGQLDAPIAIAEQHDRNMKRDVIRLLRSADKEKWLLAAGLFALLISASINLSMPYALGLIVGQTTTSEILRYTIIAGVVFTIGSCFTFLRAYLFAYAGERVVARLRQNLFESIMVQEMSFFDTTRTGELVNRLSSDCTLIQIAATLTIATLLRNVVQFLGGVIVLMVISYSLTLVMLAPLPFLGVFSFFYSRYVKKLSYQVQSSLAESATVAEESISNVQYVKTFGNEEKEFDRFRVRVNLSFELGKKMARASGTIQAGAEFASYVSVLIVIFYGAYLIDSGDISPAMLLSFVLYTVYTAHSLGAVSHTAGDFMRAVGASHRVFFIIDREPLMEVEGGKQLDRIFGQIEFKDVCFTYPSRPEAQVLNHINLALVPGKVVALVGPSGSGKSTIASLILRLYDVVQGVIKIDGTPLRELDPRWLKSQVGFVSQEPVLFATSIKENIKYGRATATDEEVFTAARSAYIHDFILSLPEGYETQCGERGVRLSGGQKQRISLARALLKNPPILILDEATSALDAESEHLVQQALSVLMQHRTVLVIAHRLSTIQKADCVAVMDRGRIVEMGRHEDLFARQGGIYRKLVLRQSMKLDDEEENRRPHQHDDEFVPINGSPQSRAHRSDGEVLSSADPMND